MAGWSINVYIIFLPGRIPFLLAKRVEPSLINLELVESSTHSEKI